MTTIIDLTDIKNDDYDSLAAAIACCEDDLLDYYLDKNPNLDVIFKQRDGSLDTPISYATRFNNENAVRILCTKMKAQGILSQHLSREILEVTPLHFAALIGNPTVATMLLAQGADPNAYSGKKDSRGETPLMCAVRRLPSYSLVEHGDWGNKEVKEQLQLWYHSKGKFPEAAIAVNWSGNIKLITALLKKKGVDPTATDKNDVSPYDLVTTLTDLKHRINTFHDGTSNPKILSVTNDVIVFEAKISNREGSEIKTIKVAYDVRTVRKLLADQIELNKREGLEHETKKFKELDSEIKSVKEKQKPLIEEHKDKAERKKIIKDYSAIIGTRVFFEMFTKKLYSEISVIGDILTDKVNRAHYTAADKAADGVAMLSDIPLVGAMVGGVPKVFGAGVQVASDHREKGKHKHLQKNVPLPSQWAEFCEDIAIAVLKQSGPYVSQLDATRSAKLSEKAVGIAFEALSKNEIKGNVQKFLVDTLVGSDVLAKMLKKLCEDQAKANAKHTTATVTSFPQHQYAAHKQKAVGAGVGASVGQSTAAKDKCVVM